MFNLNRQGRIAASIVCISLFLQSSYARSESPNGTPGVVGGTGMNKSLNPDTSVNFLGYGRRSNVNSGEAVGRTSDVHNGFSFQEAELQFFADVDPYFRANALFSVVPSSEGYEFSPEEVFLQTLSLPVTILAGKFKAAFGKHNTLHTHAFPFIDAPLINQDVLSPEGLNEVGVSASVLLPTPWFVEVTAQLLNNSNDVLYNSPNSGDVGGVAQLRNVWDLTESSTLEWSVYGTAGKNQADLTSNAYGTDLIFKWRPVEGGKYQAFTFANEYINGFNPGAGFGVGPSDARSTGERLGGLASWVQYQFAQRWWIQARVEFEGLPKAESLPDRRKQSALLGFFPTEFSGFRLQYDHLVTDNQPTENAITLQWMITIGAHPAHAY